MKARNESLHAQVEGLKAICGSAYDFAQSVHKAIQQLCEERDALRDFAHKTVNALNASVRNHRALSVEYDLVLQATL